MNILKTCRQAGFVGLCLLPMSAFAAHGFGSVYKAELYALNNSGVSGTATLAFREGDTLTVILNGTHLTADTQHIQHIHGLSDATVDAVCPTLSDDTDMDNLLSLQEAGAVYGPPIVSLEPAPTANSEGAVNYAAEIKLGENNVPSLDELGNPVNRVVVLHGMTLDGVYNPAIPVACGEITRVALQEAPAVVETPVQSSSSGGGSLGSFMIFSPWLAYVYEEKTEDISKTTLSDHLPYVVGREQSQHF